MVQQGWDEGRADSCDTLVILVAAASHCPSVASFRWRSRIEYTFPDISRFCATSRKLRMKARGNESKKYYDLVHVLGHAAVLPLRFALLQCHFLGRSLRFPPAAAWFFPITQLIVSAVGDQSYTSDGNVDSVVIT